MPGLWSVVRVEPRAAHHMRAVEIAMRATRSSLDRMKNSGASLDFAADFDYERWPTPDHPLKGQADPEGKGYRRIYAIKSTRIPARLPQSSIAQGPVRLR